MLNLIKEFVKKHKNSNGDYETKVGDLRVYISVDNETIYIEVEKEGKVASLVVSPRGYSQRIVRDVDTAVRIIGKILNIK